MRIKFNESIDEIDITRQLLELSTEGIRETMTPISPEERLEICKCGHLKRYHRLSSDGLLCKYGSCYKKCKGYTKKTGARKFSTKTLLKTCKCGHRKVQHSLSDLSCLTENCNCKEFNGEV